MSSKAVAPREASAVPALAPTPATTITAEDIAIPKLYVGNYMSDAVKHQRAKFGDVYLAASSDDSDPQVLWSLGSSDAGVLAHVLHLRKGKSYAPKGSDERLLMWDFDDPDAHPEAWTTYQYTLILPEVDPDMPARMLLTKSSKGVAQKINTVLARNGGNLHDSAFRLTSAKRQSGQNEWAIFQAASVSQEEATVHVAAAADLFEVLRPGFEQQASRQRSASTDDPEI